MLGKRVARSEQCNRPYPDSQGASSQVKDSSSAATPVGIESNKGIFYTLGKRRDHYGTLRV
jgi:hypothetical protein